MPLAHPGLDGRTHWTDERGQALCGAPLDGTVDPVSRWVCGCTVCAHLAVSSTAGPGGRVMPRWVPVAIVAAVAAVLILPTVL